jgi:NitT/TauT family transport system substrate-binding protein
MLARAAIFSALPLIRLADAALALDQVTFGTNWKAQAEDGGFYQAVATGIYEKHGLDVTIRPGGRRSTTPSCSPRARSTSTWAATCSARSTTC